MLKKQTVFICATYFSTIIASVLTNQPWYFENYLNTGQESIPLIETINTETPLAQTPVITSKKIDVEFNQEVKPIYWSTLLPTPVHTYVNPNYVCGVEQNDLNLYPKTTTSNINYSITLPSPNKIDTTGNVGKINDESYEQRKLKNVYSKSEINNKDPKRKKYNNKKYNINTQKQETSLNKMVKGKEMVSDLYYNQDSSLDENSEYIGAYTYDQPSKDSRQNKNNLELLQPCCCQCCKSSKSKSHNIKRNEKFTNFDQMHNDVEDILNVNLEYADHDGEYVRNSRNNGNNKIIGPNLQNMPKNFPIDYLNWIYNLIPNSQFGSYSQDYIFPYNLETIYQIPQIQERGDKNWSKNKRPKSKSSNKRQSNKKSSKKRKNLKYTVDDCDKVIEISPTIIKVENDNEFYSNDANAAKYTSDVNADLQFILNETPILHPEKYFYETNPDIIEIIPKIIEANPNIIKTIPKIIESNPDIIDINYNTIVESPKVIEVKPKTLDTIPVVVIEKVPKITETKTEIIETKSKEEFQAGVEPTKQLESRNNQIEMPLTLYENIDFKNENLHRSHLYDDDFFWYDYYPDFTLDNGAYITSSEEDEWFNFHKYFYNNDENTNREILKRNLSKKPKSKNLELTIHPQHTHLDRHTNKGNTRAYGETQIGPTQILAYPDFTTRLVDKEDIPSYIDLLMDKKNKPSSKNKSTHNSYRIHDIETVYAPSRVINYSEKPLFESYDSSEEVQESRLYVREGDISIVYPSPFITEYI